METEDNDNPSRLAVHVARSCSTIAATRIRRDVGSEVGGGAVKKGPWSPWEDGVLVEYVRKHGEGNWKEVAQRSGLRRCGKSCRLRWTNHLRPHLRKDRLTPAEEATILLLHSIHGNKWAKISAQLPGRTDNSIKNFMNTRAKRQKRQTAAAPAHGAASAPNLSSLRKGSQAVSASFSSALVASSSRAHPNSSSHYSQLANNRINYITAMNWPSETAPLRSLSGGATHVQQVLSMSKPLTSVLNPIEHDQLVEMLSARDVCLAMKSAASTDGTDHALSFDNDQRPEHLIDRLQQLPSTTAANTVGDIGPASCNFMMSSQLMSQFHSSSLLHHDISGRGQVRKVEPYYVQPRQLPSVQHYLKSSASSSSFTDPLALLGGQSVRLLKDAEDLSNMTCFSPVIELVDCQRSCIDEDDDRLIANSLISSCTQQLDSSTTSSSTHSLHDYTLDCIIKPLSRRPPDS
ncbi:hypothetical protein L7F22_029147 [Adiantum nelumboides]|nr:hypothetical protein [Adiantum nelumboides]